MIGPSLPPHLAQKTQEDEESDDDYGPALPPHLLAKRTSNVVTTEQTLDSDSEDEIGPQLPAAIPNKQQDEVDGVQEFLERERRRKALEEVRNMCYRGSSTSLTMSIRKKRNQNLLNVKNGC